MGSSGGLTEPNNDLARYSIGQDDLYAFGPLDSFALFHGLSAINIALIGFTRDRQGFDVRVPS